MARTGRRLIASIVDSLPDRSQGHMSRLSLDGRTPMRSTIAARLWGRLTAMRSTVPMVGVLNAALVCLADHDLAPSTLGARVAASTRSDPYAVVSTGLGVLDGPLHGRASALARSALDRAAETGAASAVNASIATFGVVPGFGHPLYPDGDPRAAVVLDLLRATKGSTRAMAVVDSVIAAARRRDDQRPNVDLALAALGLVSSMPPDAGEVIFAVARTAGWLAHAVEEYAETPLRFRPRSSYIGD